MGKRNAGGITRRGLIASAAFVPVSALVPVPGLAAAESPQVLDPVQLKTLDAFVDRLVPADNTGPGALECGAPGYIVRALGDFLAAEKSSISAGLARIEAVAVKTHGASFHELPAEKKDQIVAAMAQNQAQNEATGFEPDSRAIFARLRQLTIEGMFSDPYYGGNKAYAGWDLLRYPGPRLAVAPEDQKLKEMPKAVRRSAYGTGFEGGKRGH